MATRVAEAVNTILPDHQKGFLPERNTINATLNIIEAVSVLKTTLSQPSFLLQLDQQKAYDRVNHTYLLKVLEVFGFPTTFQKIVDQIFLDQTVNITNNKILSREFQLGRGVRQGDPLSPILFVMVIEPLLMALTSVPIGSVKTEPNRSSTRQFRFGF